MIATTTVREVLRRVGVLMDDIDPQFTRNTHSEQVDWLNDGQRAITTFVSAACSVLNAVKLKPGTRQSIEKILAADIKRPDGTSPAAPIFGVRMLDVVRNMGANGTTPGRAIRITDRDMLNRVSPDWHTKVGTEVRQYTFDPLLPLDFFVTPGIKTGASVWVDISFVARPIAVPHDVEEGDNRYGIVNDDTTLISLSDEYVEDLVDYICARAAMKSTPEGDFSVMNAFASKFIGSLNSKVTAITGTNPNLQRLPFAPEPLGAAK